MTSVLLLLVVTCVFQTGIASALFVNQQQLFTQGVNYFDATAGCSTQQAVSPGSGTPTGLTFPNLDPTTMANDIESYIKSVNPNSELLGDGQVLVASAKHANVNPFLVVAIAQKESGLASPSDFNTSHANNPFGRTAEQGQPNFQGSHNWYSWSSVEASVDYTAPENNQGSNSDETAFLRSVYGSFIDSGDLSGLINKYAPASDGNNPQEYASTVQGWIQTMASGGGSSTTPTTQTPSSTSSSCCTTGTGGSSGGTAVLVGSGSEQQAFNYFVGQGLPAAASAGLVGNFMQESGPNLDTHADNGSHWGIAQWSATRWATLQQVESGKDIYALATQLDFVWYELQHGYTSVLDQLKTVTSPVQAADIVNSDGPPSYGGGYEASGENPSLYREPNALAVYNKYGGGDALATEYSGCGSTSGTTAGTPNIIMHDVFGTADGLMGHQPTMIGIHYTAGNETSVDQLANELKNASPSQHCGAAGCSVQLTVDPQGNIYQLTSSLDVITENIINFNDADIGIEIMGQDEQTLLNNKQQFNAVVSLVTYLMNKYNIKMTQDYVNKAGLMGHMECDNWSQAHLGSRFQGQYSSDPAVQSTDSHQDPGPTYMSNLRAAVGPQLSS